MHFKIGLVMYDLHHVTCCMIPALYRLRFAMMKTFARDGIRFRYPADWSFDLEEDGEAWTATIQSGETAFALAGLRPDAGTAVRLADEILSAMKEEYPNLDAEAVVDSLAGQPAVGHDIEFLALDTVITCRTRCIETATGPFLLMCQCSEFDLPVNEPRLQSLSRSLKLDE